MSGSCGSAASSAATIAQASTAKTQKTSSSSDASQLLQEIFGQKFKSHGSNQTQSASAGQITGFKGVGVDLSSLLQAMG